MFGHQGDWSWSTSNNGRKVQMRGVGRMSDIVLSDDETDIKSMPDGTWLRITESTGMFGAVTFEARGVNGKIERKWSGLTDEAERRKWLASHLLELVRTSGLGVDARVARILKQAGPDGVLQEISRIDSAYAKRLYFQRLLQATPLDSATLARLIAQAGREMKSAYDVTTLLVTGVLPRLNAKDDQARAAYLQAVKGINSDYDRRRALTALIKTGPLTPTAVAQVLDAAGAIRSDYDIASVLTEVVRSNDISGSRDAFLAAFGTIQSDYDKRRVLTAVAADPKIGDQLLVTLLQAAAHIRSSYDRATLLLSVAGQHKLQGAARDAYLAAARTIPSRYDQDRALAALTRADLR